MLRKRFFLSADLAAWTSLDTGVAIDGSVAAGPELTTPVSDEVLFEAPALDQGRFEILVDQGLDEGRDK